MAKQFPIDGSRDALWTATAAPAPATSVLQEKTSCDVAIIGAGITGLNAALHLSKQGVSVCVLESKGIGFGASGRSGGQVNLGLNLSPSQLIEKFSTPVGERLINVVVNTPDYVFKIIRDNHLQCDPVQNGWIQGAISDSNLDAQAQLARDYSTHGCNLELLDKADVSRRVGTTLYAGGLHVPNAGSIQPLSYTRELARTVIANGARLFTDSAVTGIQPPGNRNDHLKGWTVSTAQGQIRSDQVLICTNGYTDKLANGLAKKVVPVRSILIASEPLSDTLRAAILPGEVTFVDKRRLILYFRYDRDGRLCIGDHGPMRDAFCAEDFKGLKQRVLKVFPQLSNTRWDYHWGGRIAMTKDTLPFLYQIAPGLTAGMGYNGRGVGMGTMMGKALADSVLTPSNKATDFPYSSPRTFALHHFHRTGVSMAVKWMALRDHLDSM